MGKAIKTVCFVWAFLACPRPAVSRLSERDLNGQVLTVHTYRSMVSGLGPGKTIEEHFKKHCGAGIRWVASTDSASLWGRIRMEGSRFEGDVILGLDSHLAGDAMASGLLEPLSLDPSPLSVLPDGLWSPLYTSLIPYQWGFFAIIYNREKIKPYSCWEDLALRAPLRSLILEDPRSSTVGLGFLSWTRLILQDRWPTFMRRLRPKILTVTRGWSDAYGLFLRGEAPMVFSYSLSEAWHHLEKKEMKYSAMIFDKEGHHVQVEAAGILRNSRQKELAKKFISFLLEPRQQKLLALHSWMYPARPEGTDLPKVFHPLAQLPMIREFSFTTIREKQASWVSTWTTSMIDL